jgi:polysaccharide biosynthesis protein PslF
MHAGESANAHHLCRHLAARGHDVHVLTAIGNSGTGDPGIHVHADMRRWSWLEAPRFARVVKHCAPQAVLLMYLDAIYDYHPMMTFSPTLVKRMLPGIPFVTRYESPLGGSSHKSRRLARLGRKLAAWAVGRRDVTYTAGTLLRDSDRVIVLCEHHRDVLARDWPQVRDKAVVIAPPPNVLVSPELGGTSRARGRARLCIAEDEFVIAFFGYVYPKKGIETLLTAFQRLLREGRNMRLVFIGGTLDVDSEASARYWDEMQQLCHALEVSRRTVWTGAFRSDQEDGSLYLRAADVCVLPLLNGVQLNNSSFSAMAAHGMPIVTTRGASTDHVIVEGENVLFFEPRNEGALADRLRELMDNAPLRDRLRTGIGRLAQEWLSWDKGIDRTLAAFGGAALDRD